MFENLKKIFTKGSALKGIVFGNPATQSTPWASKKRIDSYATSAYVHACVKKRSEKFGQLLNFTLKRGETDVTKHAWLDLLYKPNAFQTKNEFFELYQTFKDLSGSTFIHMLKAGATVKELHLLSPDRVTIIVSKETGLPEFYDYAKADGTKSKIPASDVIASFYPSPLEYGNSWYKGMSPLSPVAKRVDTEEQLVEYQHKILMNGGKVEGVLKFKTEVLSQEQIDEIKAEYERQYASAKRSGRPLILYGDTEYQSLGVNMQELAYLDSLKATREDILMVFGVPKTILGITDGVQKGNYEEANSMFIKDTIKPLIENVIEKLNEFMIPSEYELGFVDPTPEDVQVKLDKITNGTTNNYMTINEKRELMGLEPIEGGDVILVQFSQVPLGDVGMEYEENTPTKGVKKKSEHPLKNKSFRKKYYDTWIKVADRRELRMKMRVNSYLREQRDRVIRNLEKQRIYKKGLVDEVFNLQLEVGLAENVIIGLIRQYLEQSGQGAIDLVGYDKPFIVTREMEKLMDKRNALFAKSINETTFEQLKRQFAISNDANETRDQLVKRIRETYGDISKGRANVIARTETLVASQSGKAEGYKQSGIDIKIWVAVMDEATRDSHASIDGEEVAIDAQFSNGLEYPGDPNGSAEEVIGCRCSI